MLERVQQLLCDFHFLWTRMGELSVLVQYSQDPLNQCLGIKNQMSNHVNSDTESTVRTHKK